MHRYFFKCLLFSLFAASSYILHLPRLFGLGLGPVLRATNSPKSFGGEPGAAFVANKLN